MLSNESAKFLLDIVENVSINPASAEAPYIVSIVQKAKAELTSILAEESKPVTEAEPDAEVPADSATS